MDRTTKAQKKKFRNRFSTNLRSRSYSPRALMIFKIGSDEIM